MDLVGSSRMVSCGLLFVWGTECGFRHEDGFQVCVRVKVLGRGSGKASSLPRQLCTAATTFTLFETRLLTADQNVDHSYDEEGSSTSYVICEKGGIPLSTSALMVNIVTFKDFSNISYCLKSPILSSFVSSSFRYLQDNIIVPVRK